MKGKRPQPGKVTDGERRGPALPPAPGAPGPARRWMPAVVMAAGIAAYLGSFRGVFLFDDVPHIVEVPHIRRFGSAWGLRHYSVLNRLPAAVLSPR